MAATWEAFCPPLPAWHPELTWWWSTESNHMVQLAESTWPKGWERKMPNLNCSHCPVPSSSWLQAAGQHHALFLLFSLAEPQEQYKRSQQMNSSRPGGAGPPCWVNQALAEWPVGPALLFCTFLKEQERQRALEKPSTLCLAICNPGNDTTHFAQDTELYCQVCGQPDGCSPPSSWLPTGQRHPFSVIRVTRLAAWASWAKWEHSCSVQLY